MRGMDLILASFLAATLSASGQSGSREVTVYSGMCDASAAVCLDSGRFVAADDEDNVLRIFDRTHPGMPVSVTDLSEFLQVSDKSPETDLEGAARIDQRIYWITSHGRNAEGKKRPNRQRFFATDIVSSDSGPALVPFGIPYMDLLRDLAREPKLGSFQLAAAAGKAPKERGALNIEGLSSMPGGRVLIGFRNPIPEGRALLVPLLNPDAVTRGTAAAFGEPILLDLGGLGIRCIEYSRDRYFIIAGPHGDTGASRLYSWRGGLNPPVWLKEVNLEGFKPEAMLFTGGAKATRCEMISDDGTMSIGGEACKQLKDPAMKRFRTVCVSLPEMR